MWAERIFADTRRLSRVEKEIFHRNCRQKNEYTSLEIAWRLLLESYVEDGQVHWMIKFFARNKRPRLCYFALFFDMDFTPTNLLKAASPRTFVREKKLLFSQLINNEWFASYFARKSRFAPARLWLGAKAIVGRVVKFIKSKSTRY